MAQVLFINGAVRISVLMGGGSRRPRIWRALGPDSDLIDGLRIKILKENRIAHTILRLKTYLASYTEPV